MFHEYFVPLSYLLLLSYHDTTAFNQAAKPPCRVAWRISYQAILVAMALLSLTAYEAAFASTIEYVPKAARRPWQKWARHCIDTWRDKRAWEAALKAHPELEAQSAVAYSSEIGLTGKERAVNFDTDSGTIGIDNRCSGCISHDIRDFVGGVRDSGEIGRAHV